MTHEPRTVCRFRPVRRYESFLTPTWCCLRWFFAATLRYLSGKVGKTRRFAPLASRQTIGELIRVLAYPKFRLNTREQQDLLSDYLPFCTTVKIADPPPPTPVCRDPFDTPFLELAIAGGADFLVTGDQDLISLSAEFSRPIVKVDEFLARLARCFGNR